MNESDFKSAAYDTEYETSSVRYVHAKSWWQPRSKSLPIEKWEVTQEASYPRFTIAYARCDDSIIFAYAKMHSADLRLPYDKKVGRATALERLVAYVTGKKAPRNQCGVIQLSEFKQLVLENSSIGFVLSKNVVDNMNMYDFSHAFISKILEKEVNSLLVK